MAGFNVFEALKASQPDMDHVWKAAITCLTRVFRNEAVDTIERNAAKQLLEAIAAGELPVILLFVRGANGQPVGCLPMLDVALAESTPGVFKGCVLSGRDRIGPNLNSILDHALSMHPDSPDVFPKVVAVAKNFSYDPESHGENLLVTGFLYQNGAAKVDPNLPAILKAMENQR